MAGTLRPAIREDSRLKLVAHHISDRGAFFELGQKCPHDVHGLCCFREVGVAWLEVRRHFPG
eukprot:6974347-Pyramimonas_sp.AAC.1